MLPAAVLFDMDGTIVHSEPLWMQCETEFVQAHGGTWNKEKAMQLVGNSLEKSGQILAEAVANKFTGMEIIDLLVDAMVALYQRGDTPWRPGFPQLLALLNELGVKTAIVSASYARLVSAVAGAIDFGVIDTTVGGDQVVRDKPHPDPYLQAASQLGVDIKDCIVIEDSDTGVASGLAAGAHTVAIACVKPIPAQAGLSRLESLADIDTETLTRLAGGEIIDRVDDSTWQANHL